MKTFDLVNISDLLKNYCCDTFEIQKQDVQILTGPGEHYGSFILKVDLEIKTKSDIQILNLVSKQIPVSELLQKAFDVQVTFMKEAFAYTVTLPTLLKFQMEFNVPEEKLLNCFPQCYGARYNLHGNDETVDRNGMILFENLKAKGYESIDRIVGCDLETTNIVLRDLAMFHAVPLALKLLRPQVFDEKVMPGLVRHKGAEQLGDEVIGVFHNTIMNVAKQCTELAPYLDRLQKIVDYFAIHPYTERPEPSKAYGTITHCDIWTSNMMALRNSDGVTTKIKFLDLQLTNFSSPIRDLVFFLFTSVQNKVLEENIDIFIKHYHEHFVETLKFFDVDLEPYSWENFQIELNAVAPDEVYHILMMLKVIFSQKGKVTNTLDNFQISDWTRADLLGEDHKRKLRDTVLALVSKHWI